MMFNEYFNLVDCEYKNSCEKANTYSCDRCIRNKIQKIDNYKIKSYQSFPIKNSSCDNCSNNIKNGGTGICHCTLGQQTIY